MAGYGVCVQRLRAPELPAGTISFAEQVSLASPETQISSGDLADSQPLDVADRVVRGTISLTDGDEPA